MFRIAQRRSFQKASTRQGTVSPVRLGEKVLRETQIATETCSSYDACYQSAAADAFQEARIGTCNLFRFNQIAYVQVSLYGSILQTPSCPPH